MSRPAQAKLASLALLLSAAASASAAPTLVAFSGDLAPGAGGATYSSFTNVVLNPSGQVAFNAVLAGGTSTSGIFTGTPGSLTPVALQNTAAPAGGSYLYGAVTNAATLNSAGDVAFVATLTGGTATSGVFAGTPGSLATVALKGGIAPGTGGGVYNTFTTPSGNAASSPVLSPTGIVAFSSTLTGASPASAAGGFSGSYNSVSPYALVGGAAPGGGAYTTTVTAPVINSTGKVAFISIASGSQGIYSGAPGAVQLVAQQFQTTPDGNNSYGAFGQTIINNAGQVAFTSTLNGSQNGVFAGAPGSLQTVALPGGAAAGTGGETFTNTTSSPFSGITINGGGQVAFTGALVPGGTGTATTGAFLGAPGSVQAIVLGGPAGSTSTVVPDGTGSTIASFSTGLIPNGNGQLTFVANLTGPGVVTGTNDMGLFVASAGSITELVRAGDSITVNGTQHIVSDGAGKIGFVLSSGGQDGRGSEFNDYGQVAYRLSFTDGTSGVFLSSVPEPTSLGMLAGGAGLLMRRRNRSRAANRR